MLLWKLSLGVQPGIGHCSTRYCRPRSLASFSSGTKLCSNSIRFWSIDLDWSRPTNPVTAGTPSSTAASIAADHEVVLLAAGSPGPRGACRRSRRCRRWHAGGVDGGEHALGAHLGERLAQVERVGDRVEHRLGGDVGERRVQGGRQLDAVGAEVLGEVEPLLDRQVGIGVAPLARRELLEGGGQHADGHVDGGEGRVRAVRSSWCSDRSARRWRRVRSTAMGACWRADSMAACSTRWVIRASAKSGRATTGCAAAEDGEDVGGLVDEAVLVAEAVAVRPPGRGVRVAVAAAGDVDRRPPLHAAVGGGVVEAELVHPLEVEAQRRRARRGSRSGWRCDSRWPGGSPRSWPGRRRSGGRGTARRRRPCSAPSRPAVVAPAPAISPPAAGLEHGALGDEGVLDGALDGRRSPRR